MLFAVGSTLVNCTNSYDVEKPDPQMVELAKYAKQHVPEEHPKVPFTLFFHGRANITQYSLNIAQSLYHSSCFLRCSSVILHAIQD